MVAVSFVSSFPVVAFSGSRSVVPRAALSAVCGRVSPSASVLVGCASGVDSFVASQFGSRAEIFRAESYGSVGSSWAARLAARSSAMVRAASVSRGCLVAFPGRVCPSGLFPSRSWPGGFGSGTWSTLGLAVGLGVPSLLWLPAGIPCPPWGFSFLGGAFGGEFFVLRPVIVSQGSLF